MREAKVHKVQRDTVRRSRENMWPLWPKQANVLAVGLASVWLTLTHAVFHLEMAKYQNITIKNSNGNAQIYKNIINITKTCSRPYEVFFSPSNVMGKLNEN